MRDIFTGVNMIVIAGVCGFAALGAYSVFTVVRTRQAVRRRAARAERHRMAEARWNEMLDQRTTA